ncbi:MAG TPA: proteasome accessory factor PafA2 family protein [Candidatus Saccharimonadales bacterium]
MTTGEIRHSPLPAALGSEEESMLMVGMATSKEAAMRAYLTHPVNFIDNIPKYLPKSIKSSGGWRNYLQNGGLIYDGTHCDGELGNLECATPECVTPVQVNTYIQASERLIVDALQSYVEKEDSGDYGMFARWHRRVVDAYGTSKASHDNFGMSEEWLESVGSYGLERLLIGQFASRSLLTGAGLVTPAGYFAAQKTHTVSSVRDYGYVSSAYRIASEDETGPRLEVRCSDINISPWATQVRLGSMSMLMAAAQTELADKLLTIVPGVVDDTDAVNMIRGSGRVSVDPETLAVKLSPPALKEIDVQEQLASLYADALGKYIELPPELRDIAVEVIQYCQDIRRVHEGQAPLSVLADRSDFAAKLLLITQSIRRDRADGITRKLGDITSRMQDMRYDMIFVASSDLNGTTSPSVRYGAGFKLRDSGHFRLTIPTAAVEHAYYRPPKETRAYTRGELIRRGVADVASWSDVAIPKGASEDLQEVFSLGDVLDSTASSGEIDKLTHDAALRAKQPAKLFS